MKELTLIDQSGEFDEPKTANPDEPKSVSPDVLNLILQILTSLGSVPTGSVGQTSQIAISGADEKKSVTVDLGLLTKLIGLSLANVQKSDEEVGWFSELTETPLRFALTNAVAWAALAWGIYMLLQLKSAIPNLQTIEEIVLCVVIGAAVRVLMAIRTGFAPHERKFAPVPTMQP